MGSRSKTMATYATSLLFFCLTTLFRGISSFSILYPGEIKVKALKHCLMQNKVAFPEYECNSLLEEKPCQKGEWLVLTLENDLEHNLPKFTCTKKPCGNDENMGMIESGKCKSMDDISDCSSANMELSQTPYGIAECACKDGYLPRFDENSNIVECIEELTQGHCKIGQKYSWNLDSEEPMCLWEDCSTVKDMTKGCEQEGYLPYFDENGKTQCYEEFSQGPCDEGEIFSLDWDSPHSVQCNTICEKNEVSVKQGLIGGLLNCPDGQQLDTRGVCKDVISASDIFTFRSGGPEGDKKKRSLNLKSSRNFRRFLRRYHKLRNI